MADEADQSDGDARGQRLDKWLWHARFAKTRTAAARLVTDGHVRINSRRENTSARRVRAGDVLTIALSRDVRVVRLRGFAPRRGPAVEARTLYEDVAGEAEPAAEDGGPPIIDRLAPQDGKR